MAASLHKCFAFCSRLLTVALLLSCACGRGPTSLTDGGYVLAGEWDIEGFHRCGMILSPPLPIAVGPGGDVYVADALTWRVRRYDPAGLFLDEWYVAQPPSPDTPALASYTFFPRAIAVAPDGNVYALCGDRVCYYSPDGDYLGGWGDRGKKDSQFTNPTGLAVGSDGRVYVADTYNERVQYFSSTGSFLGKWGSYGAGEGKFHYPEGIAVAPNGGTVYVTDTLNERVQYFSADGSFRGAWGKEGTGPGEFKYPNAVAVGPSGDVIVSDMSKDNVECFGRRGRLKGILEYDAARCRGDLFWGVAAAPSGDVYVSDGRDFKVRRFERSADTRVYLWLAVAAFIVLALVASLIICLTIKTRRARGGGRGQVRPVAGTAR